MTREFPFFFFTEPERSSTFGECYCSNVSCRKVHYLSDFYVKVFLLSTHVPPCNFGFGFHFLHRWLTVV